MKNERIIPPVSKISNITWRPLGWDTRFVKHFWTSNQEGNIILLDFTHIPPISSSYRFLDMWKPNHSPFTQSCYTTLWTVYSCFSFFFLWKYESYINQNCSTPSLCFTFLFHAAKISLTAELSYTCLLIILVIIVIHVNGYKQMVNIHGKSFVLQYIFINKTLNLGTCSFLCSQAFILLNCFLF